MPQSDAPTGLGPPATVNSNATLTAARPQQTAMVPQERSHREDDDRPITGWHDILELAAEAGLEPVGPTLQSGLNFAAAF